MSLPGSASQPALPGGRDGRIQQGPGEEGRRAELRGLPAESAQPQAPGSGGASSPHLSHEKHSEFCGGITRHCDASGAHTSLKLSPEFSKVKLWGCAEGWSRGKAGMGGSCLRGVGSCERRAGRGEAGSVLLVGHLGTLGAGGRWRARE